MADRGFSSTLETALSAADSSLALLCDLDLIGGRVRVWSGDGTITWSSQSWYGLGKLAGIDKIADSVDASDIGVVLTLNYLDDDIRNEFVTNDNIGRDVIVYLAAFNADTGTVTDAYALFPGFVDQVDITDAGETGQLRVRLASELSLLNRPRFYKLTNAHQQALFPGDLGLQYASKMDEVIYWGRKPMVPTQSLPIGPPPSIEPYPGYNDQFLFPLP